VPDAGDRPGQHERGRYRVPASTYRLQLHAGFGFRAAAGQSEYLAKLGVTHVYLSPILQAAPGSMHGYDVVDHSRISAELGGEDEFRAMAAQFASHGIGIVADIVPNHMGVPAPEYLNRQLWSVLRDGQQSRCAHWFDIDWSAGDGQLLLPILAGPLRSCLDALSVTRLSALPGAAVAQLLADHGDEPVLLYQEHVLPLRPDTAGLPLPELLAAQCYRLSSWRAAAAELNWRRFFDITSLIAIRVCEPDVFAATHGLLLGFVAEGLIDGLRVDHPDGLADPGRYLQQLATATGGGWVVAEKILTAGEELPAGWQCAGSTGYDTLAAVGMLFTDPAGIARLSREYLRFTGRPADFPSVARAARREMAGHQLSAEVARLARLLGRTGDPLLRALGDDDARLILAELLAAFDVYRTYVVPGSPPGPESAGRIAAAASRAGRRIPHRLHPARDALVAVLLGRGVPADCEDARGQLITAFQQTCPAIQAKGVEDTAMYRWSRLISACEVGADPARPAASPAAFHAFAARLAGRWPATMTTLSTHDSKRQEDVRARIAVLAESPAAWAREVSGWHQHASRLAAVLPDQDTEYLLWQTLVGAWPIGDDRLAGYLRKAMREAKTATSWVDPDLGYESTVLDLADLVLADHELTGRISAFVTWITPDANANSLGAKLVQLTMPGVPDVYQGCELAGFSLVDPDNRRPVDFARRRVMLAALDQAATRDQENPAAGLYPRPPDCPGKVVARASLDAGKLLVCLRALRLRRDHPDWFGGSYEPLAASGIASKHAVAFCRAGQVVTVATRLPAGLRRVGGWQDTTLRLPSGSWHDVLTDTPHPGAEVPLAALTAALPVALLVRSGAGAAG
jgi:(1->4)-alpha-D-glucan 1-alpha-D-glucosylmutase